ncbi:monofunctional biosynthetic peptidoglycan transglycosylase [Stappia sp. 28M-7]|uniref:monofunctional biosynthetic peptidoglycan transglycosylase n=1 Tax=Stappia sp. 28M-7 TaxID=2762596 RepID=UPI00163B6619|nr:monofunctional biosynthetic peptidoglycan transglycosylase [Stappia sp. 28M-7]MBC2861489.1 monofunctional biosynthetic peptidoglycan transglycosylase [Stappia sp. 28M-7]
MSEGEVRSETRRARGGRLRRIVLRALLVVLLLPPVLTLLWAVVPPVSTLMLARYVQGLWVDRDYVSLDDISPHLVRSVVASEDARFCQHGGIDWEALESQIAALNEGDGVRGASTITMQVAKNLFLWNDRSYVRKAVELPLALMIDAMLTKRRILEIYLNIAEWGEGVFGAEAASQAWFGKPAKDLDRTEAARLATALPNPLARNPARPRPGHDRLARINRGRAAAIEPHLECIPGFGP